MRTTKDTSVAVAARFQKMIMERNSAERLLMGCSMFDTTKKIVESAILNQSPGITPQKMKEEIFLRFYGMEFSETEKEKILNSLRTTHSTS